ncbi:hypothetical protein [Candidatus Synchoanobacter obligatus]|uniref:Uncharacterized protein n=1 Tax=Candidatus Synchoanobacter obligatus TaxID=2919597 RepID=A0ABT1L731_9GAMM|nr:hypothetical protein [Candidatus Synchoanobacter obligatus]MCP8352671.1 hypothetical protein [Candidatus Synchoanobacter obligatus]
MAGAQTNKAIINDFSRGITIGIESLKISVPKNMVLQDEYNSQGSDLVFQSKSN